MSKSRQEKSRTPAQQNAPPPPSNDIIPGRFTENDWYHMVAEEDGEEFVTDVVQDIVQATLDVIYEKYIQQQTLPYSVDAARELILQIVEWQFLTCDHGEENPGGDVTWLGEEEPLAPITDSWAQGSVPVVTQRATSTASASTESSTIDSETPSSMEDRPRSPEPPYENMDLPYTPASIASPQQPLSSENTAKEMESIAEVHPVLTDPKSQAKTEIKRVPYKPRKGKLPSFSGVDLTSVTDEHVLKKQQHKPRSPEALDQHGLTMLSSSSSILKAQQGRPPGRKEVMYDDRGNVVAVMRINPDKLPSHRVRTKYTIVDPEAEIAAQARSRMKKKTPLVTTFQKNRSDKTETGTVVSYGSTRYMAHRQEPNKGVTSLPPPLVDTMDLNAGVVVREGGLMRRGPQQVHRQVEKTPSTVTLLPLDASARQSVPVNGLLHASSPVIKPFNNNEPIPPISQTRAVEIN